MKHFPVCFPFPSSVTFALFIPRSGDYTSLVTQVKQEVSTQKPRHAALAGAQTDPTLQVAYGDKWGMLEITFIHPPDLLSC